MSEYTDQARRYLILIEGGPPSNYSAWSPDLPGCAATGDWGPIPEPSGPGVYIERAAAMA